MEMDNEKVEHKLELRQFAEFMEIIFFKLWCCKQLTLSLWIDFDKEKRWQLRFIYG